MKLLLEANSNTKILGSCFVAVLLPTLIFVARRRHRSLEKGTLQVAVLGSGAIGTFVGLRLISVARLVTLVGRTSLRKALQSSNNTLVLREKSGRKIAHRVGVGGLKVLLESDDWSSLADHDVILLTVKTVATRAVGASLAAALPRDARTILVSLQNGVHNTNILRECLASSHPHVTILAGVVALAVEWIPRTSTFSCNVPGKIYIERPADTTAVATAIRLVQALTTAGVPTHLRNDNMESLLDSKLLLNAALNPVNALAGVPIPAMLADRGYRRVVSALLYEGSSVLGLSVWIKVVARALEMVPGCLFRAILHPEYKSSMLQDIERKRETTEVEDFNGEICKRGDAPLHQIILALVKTLERERLFVRSSDDLLSKLGLSTN